MNSTVGRLRKVYEFAAGAGALEGYVYPKKVEESYLLPWVERLFATYEDLSVDERDEFQDLCDGTLGRAIQALVPLLGDHHEVIVKMKSMTRGALPSSPDDFF